MINQNTSSSFAASNGKGLSSYAMKAYMEYGGSTPFFSTLTLEEGEWSTSSLCHFACLKETGCY
jgi:hypothetical protein